MHLRRHLRNLLVKAAVYWCSGTVLPFFTFFFQPNPPRDSAEWKLEYNARTSAERCNKREKMDYKLEDGRYRSSKMWYCRLFAIMMCQHLDAWDLPKTPHLKDVL